jgi:hypothetical protein
MADDRPEDIETSADLSRARRAPPTIELQATEVSEKPATEVSEKPVTEVSGGPDAEVSNPPAVEAPPESATQASPSSDAQGASETSAPTAATAEAADAAAASGQPPRERRPRTPWIAAVLVSAVSGAIAAGVVMAVFAPAGPPNEATAPGLPQADHEAVDALVARVATIESKTAAPTGAAVDPATATRIGVLEKTVTSLRDELAKSQSQSQQLLAAVSDLKSAPRDAAPAPDLSAINNRIGQLEKTTGAQLAAAAQQSAKPADDAPLRRVVAATLLDVSVRQGEPYAAALQTAKGLALDPAVLKPLDAFAATGVPTPSALSRDLLALLPKTAAAPEAVVTAGTSIVDRLQAGAARLVRIQRTDNADSTSTDRSAVLIRAAAAAQHNDIAGARAELNALPGADRAAVQPGIDRLDARDAALAASRQFAADAMAALAKPAP